MEPLTDAGTSEEWRPCASLSRIHNPNYSNSTAEALEWQRSVHGAGLLSHGYQGALGDDQSGLGKVRKFSPRGVAVLGWGRVLTWGM